LQIGLDWPQVSWPLTRTRIKGRIPETTIECVRCVRQVLPGSTVSIEIETPNRGGLVELAAEADVVFYSRSWAEVSCHINTGREHAVRLKLGSGAELTVGQSRGYTGAEACLRGESPLKAYVSIAGASKREPIPVCSVCL
jgi:hypothetical protein